MILLGGALFYMFNPGKLLKLKASWDTFVKNHPKFPLFLNAVKKNAMEEGTMIEFNVTTKDGRQISSNVRLNKKDIELFEELSELLGQ